MSGTWTFLQLVVSGPFPLSRPWPLVYTSLSKAILLLITRGYPGIFDMTKRVYLETIVISPPSNLSQDSAPADALMCWLLVGSKAEDTSVGAHPRRSAVAYLKPAGRRYHRHLKGTCTFNTFNHIPIDRQSFTAQPIPLPELFVWRGCFILLISLPPFSAIAHQNLPLEGGHLCPIQCQI